MQEVLSMNPANCTQSNFEKITISFKDLTEQLVFLSVDEFDQNDKGIFPLCIDLTLFLIICLICLMINFVTDVYF